MAQPAAPVRLDPTKTLLHVAPGQPAPAPPPAAPQTPQMPSQVPSQAGAPPASGGGLKQTMLGFASPAMALQPAAPASPPAVQPPVAQAPQRSFKSTMLGGPSPALPLGVMPPAAAPASTAPAPPAGPASFKSTMLGGMSPALPAQAVASTPPSAPQGQAARLVGSNTVLGVAVPGIAPLRPGETPAPAHAAPAMSPARTMVMQGAGRAEPMAPPPIIPAPAPLEDLPAPSRPRLVKKGGIPLVAVALVTGALLVVGGGALAFFWHGAPPISAQPTETPDGKDVLHLRCDPASCTNGTTAELNGVTSTFTSGESDLPLAEALHVGDNPLSLKVDRPGMGRDEVVKLVVPVAYRVRADVSTMGSQHPSITIHVEALAGSDVRVAGKPVTLDSNGAGAYAIDESTATEGAADESRVISADVPYTVTPPAGSGPAQAAQTGTVSARVAISPLRVDAPCASAVVAVDHIVVAGRAAKGASVTIDGAPATVNADGAFEATVPLPAPGERTLQIRSGTAALIARTVHLSVKRVTSLAEEARAFEQQKTVGYDAALAGLAGGAALAAGAPAELIVVDGEVIEPRASGHRMLILVDDKRGCAKGPCLARVVVGQDLSIARGDRLRAYGRVARAFTTPVGQTVPEIEADFALQSRR